MLEDMKKINRILAYGCSYTAGDEIMDHIKMGISFEECNRIKQRYQVVQQVVYGYLKKDVQTRKEG